jgi:hypothetical protein
MGMLSFFLCVYIVRTASIVLVLSAVDRGFAPLSDQTKDNIIGVCCFSAKHALLRSKSKEWLDRNRNNVTEWRVVSTRGLFSVSYYYQNPTKRVSLIHYHYHPIKMYFVLAMIYWNTNCSIWR